MLGGLRLDLILDLFKHTPIPLPQIIFETREIGCLGLFQVLRPMKIVPTDPYKDQHVKNMP